MVMVPNLLETGNFPDVIYGPLGVRSDRQIPIHEGDFYVQVTESHLLLPVVSRFMWKCHVHMCSQWNQGYTVVLFSERRPRTALPSRRHRLIAAMVMSESSLPSPHLCKLEAEMSMDEAS
jgi:hypothetical protein